MANDGRRQDPAFLAAAVWLLLAAHLAFSLWPALRRVDHDFGNLYVAARIVREGRTLDRAYERDAFLAEASPFPELGFVSLVPQPPANALMLLPFARLEPRAAKVAWTLLLAASLIASFAVTRKLVSLSGSEVALVFLLPTAALANALAYGQPYPLLLLCFCLSLLALLRGRPLAAGLLLAPTLLLKLYGLPFLAYFLWTRRFKAAAGLVLGGLLLTGLSVAFLGLEVHRVFVAEVLPLALRGEIQDPYSTIWGSLSSLTYRLFRFERDLNPLPVADLPALAATLARGLPVAVLVSAVGASRRADHGSRLRREWAILMVASLVVSPLAATYHFVLLVLPIALLWAEERSRRARVWVLLAALAFAASALPHYGARWATGWGNLLAYTRLYALLLVLALAMAGLVSRRALLLAAMAGVVVGLSVLPLVPEEAWEEIEAARGYLAASPVDCGDEQGWLTMAGTHLVVGTSSDRRLTGEGGAAGVSVRCANGRILAAPAGPLADHDARGDLEIDSDRHFEGLWLTRGAQPRLRVAAGRFRRPRISPDGRWVVAESWEGRSWDVRAFELATGQSRLVASGPSNELEPAWSASGDAVLFASDRRRGLGSTALYRAPFGPVTPSQ